MKIWKRGISYGMSMTLVGSLLFSGISVSAADRISEVVAKCWEELRMVEEKERELDKKAQEIWTQVDLNQNAAEQYKLWDDEINVLWGHLKEILDAETMSTLTKEEISWIREKEARIEEEGLQVQGGSMQPMVEFSVGADLTKIRVYELMDYLPQPPTTDVSGKEEIARKCWQELGEVERKDEKLLKEDDGSLSQIEMNRNAAERYRLWDDELNVLWGHLKELLDADTMSALTKDEVSWIKKKEAEIEAEGEAAGYGTMRPLMMDGTGARLTKERVYFLMNYVPYVDGAYTGPGNTEIPEFEIAQSKEEHKAMFGKVVSQYKKVQKENFYLDIDSDEPLDYPYYVNPNVTVLAGMTEGYKLYYAYLDLDWDGEDELFIGGGPSKEWATFVDVFDYKDGQPMRYFEPYDLGPRVYLEIYENGMMEVLWSDSAADSGFDFYFPDENGYTIDSLSIHGDEENQVGFYHSFWTETPITEVEFDELYQGYVSQGLLAMKWKTLK